MAWLLLFLAGLLEIVWAVGLKYSDGLSRFWPSVLTVSALLLSFWLLALAVKQLPIGTAYGVWVGIGAAGTAIAGIILLSEPINMMKVTGILLVIVGVVCLESSA